MSDSDPLYTPDDKNLVASTLVRNNPWDVPNLDEYLFYCCPECELKTKEYEIFYNHAVIIHELAKQTLQPILDDTEMVTEDIGDKDEHSDREVYKDIKLMEAEVVLDKSVVDNFVQKESASLNERISESGFNDDSDRSVVDNLIKDKEAKSFNQTSFESDSESIDIKEEFLDAYSDDTADKMPTNDPLYFENVAIKKEVKNNPLKENKSETKRYKSGGKLHSGKRCTKCLQLVHPHSYSLHVKKCDGKIKAHRMKKAPLQPWQCYFCGLIITETKDKKVMKEHVKLLHDQNITSQMYGIPRDHQCMECKVVFRTEAHLKEHVCGITNPSINYSLKSGGTICPSCGLTFTTHRYFLKHHNRVHLQERKFECQQCEAKYYSHFRLLKHIKEQHVEQPVICDVCGKMFASNMKMKFHKATIHDGTRKKKENFYKCKICETKFSTVSSLRKHSFEIHNVEVPWQYPCTHCDRGFERRPLLMKHLLKVHQITS